MLLRYRELVDTPRETLDRVSDFLGVATGLAHAVAPENVKPFVADTARYRLPARAARSGAALGAYVPPRCGVRRAAERRAARGAGALAPAAGRGREALARCWPTSRSWRR